MDLFHERLILRAATIDELLSDAFEPLQGLKGHTDLAARRLAAWCRSCASGDWSLMSRRLDRDGLTLETVLTRFATVRRRPTASPPAWIEDAIWIEAALQQDKQSDPTIPLHSQPFAFEHLFEPLIEQAEKRLWSPVDARIIEHLQAGTRVWLRLALLKELSSLAAPPIYERFAKARQAASGGAATPASGTARYDHFVAEMRAGGFRRLFEEKPVLLRLIATIVRQWIETSREFVVRFDADLPQIRRDILHSAADSAVARIDGDISDPHNCGRSVKIVSFADGSRVVYKPKDLRLDVAWHALIQRLNQADPPLQLRAVRAIVRDGYGWTEFIEHAGCADADGYGRFFRRAGAWLALFHCFAASDMHQENMIAAGDHPVPIDLETILQPTDDAPKTTEVERQAFDDATETLANSVMMVGLLPAYGRAPDNSLFAMGGMTADWNFRTALKWDNINSDQMRPVKTREVGTGNPNLPHVGGRYAKFADHIEDFIAGFADYAKFLLQRSRDVRQSSLFDGFAGVLVRKVIRPTRFYAMLLQRLKSHQTMDDGVTWSAQADFIARLSEWDKNSDPVWRLQRAERSALLALNVPHFVTPSDGNEIRDQEGTSARTGSTSGLDRARARVRRLDDHEIDWQVEVIRENTNSLRRAAVRAEADGQAAVALHADVRPAPTTDIFIAETDRIAGELSRHAIRRGPGAAWIGLDWLGDSEVFQLVCLGQDIYNGVSGIAIFFAAHAAVTGARSSGELALASLSHVRKNLRSRNAARTARSMGIGGAIGLGSVIYALAVIAKCLADEELLADAHIAAELLTDDLIAADKQLDIISGSAGAIVSLLRLYRDIPSADVLRRAEKCGEHLLALPRIGPQGRRSWVGQGFGAQALNGMSHGAAGFAYALASLSAATGREDFAQAAAECIAFENSSYDPARNNWPDRRGSGEPGWPCQWCHGAPGIGLARAATAKRGTLDVKLMASDVGNAVAGVERGWPGQVDTLCCGTLGNIEFLGEAGRVLGRDDLRELASRRLMAVLERAASTGDYRWNTGRGQFNLGLFRGLAGVGYTLLRQVDASLPNVLIWE